MTSSTIQSVPDTMIDLAMHSDMPYITTTRHQYKGQWYSTLNDMVLTDIIHAYNEGVMKKIYADLDTTCFWQIINIASPK